MSRNFGGNVGLVDPGNATDLNLGGWFSFNPKASFVLGYDQMTVWSPSQNGSQILLTGILQMGSVLFGTSYNVRPHFFSMVTVAAGVTPDKPNVRVLFRMPLFYWPGPVALSSDFRERKRVRRGRARAATAARIPTPPRIRKVRL